jgi:hypothetical protein
VRGGGGGRPKYIARRISQWRRPPAKRKHLNGAARARKFFRQGRYRSVDIYFRTLVGDPAHPCPERPVDESILGRESGETGTGTRRQKIICAHPMLKPHGEIPKETRDKRARRAVDTRRQKPRAP